MGFVKRWLRDCRERKRHKAHWANLDRIYEARSKAFWDAREPFEKELDRLKYEYVERGTYPHQWECHRDWLFSDGCHHEPPTQKQRDDCAKAKAAYDAAARRYRPITDAAVAPFDRERRAAIAAYEKGG